MRTLPSPSVISSSAMPDSATRSIRVLSFLRSIQTIPCHFTGTDTGPAAKENIDKNKNGMCDLAGHRMLQRGLVTERAQSGDHPDSQVGQIRVMAKWLSLVNIGYVYFDEGNGHCSQGVA